MKANKTKEKEIQHDLEHTANKEEIPVRGTLQNAKQHVITMAKVAALLEQERAKAPKERFYTQRPPCPLRILSKPYLERYEPQVFAQYNQIRTLGATSYWRMLCVSQTSAPKNQRRDSRVIPTKSPKKPTPEPQGEGYSSGCHLRRSRGRRSGKASPTCRSDYHLVGKFQVQELV